VGTFLLPVAWCASTDTTSGCLHLLATILPISWAPLCVDCHILVPPVLVVLLQASSAYTAGPHHAMFSLSLSSIYKQDVLSSGTDFLRVDGVPVSIAVWP
jgi:hypothetical protein